MSSHNRKARGYDGLDKEKFEHKLGVYTFLAIFFLKSISPILDDVLLLLLIHVLLESMIHHPLIQTTSSLVLWFQHL